MFVKVSVFEDYKLAVHGVQHDTLLLTYADATVSFCCCLLLLRSLLVIPGYTCPQEMAKKSTERRI